MWLRGSGTTRMELVPLPPTVDVEGLATLLCCSPETVKSNASRSPEKLPPPVRTGGRRLIWITKDVFTWLEARRAGPAPAALRVHGDRGATAPATVLPRRRGRPTKAEQIARRRAGGAR
jgi:hypothetical protein